MSETQLPAIINEDDFKAIVSSAPIALSKNTSQSNSALKAATDFVREHIALESEEDDAAASGLLVKIRKTHSDMNARRKSLTVLLNNVISTFTGLENKIDASKSIEVQAIQKLRDAYATKKINDQKLKEQEEQRKLAVAQEKIDLKAELVIALGQHYLNFVATQRQMLMDLYNSLTLDNFERQSALLKQFNFIYPYSHFTDFKFQSKRTWSLDAETKKEIWLSVKEGKHNEYQKQFKTTIEADIQQLVDKLPAKKKELQEIADADAANKKKLLEEQKQREEDNKLKLLQEAEQSQQESINTATTNKQVEEVNTLFDHQANAELIETPTGTVRRVCTINVTKNAGWLAIVAHYFQYEGSASTEDLSKKTLGSMKTFCQNLYLKKDIRIDNPFLEYEDGIKTIATK